jgi:hypothetical protein
VGTVAWTRIEPYGAKYTQLARKGTQMRLIAQDEASISVMYRLDYQESIL